MQRHASHPLRQSKATTTRVATWNQMPVGLLLQRATYAALTSFNVTVAPAMHWRNSVSMRLVARSTIPPRPSRWFADPLRRRAAAMIARGGTRTGHGWRPGTICVTTGWCLPSQGNSRTVSGMPRKLSNCSRYALVAIPSRLFRVASITSIAGRARAYLPKRASSSAICSEVGPIPSSGASAPSST